MPEKAKSDNLRKAKENKNDEFYTRLEDIEAEISMHPDYVRQFYGKTVFCNCDDPEWSNFFIFFRNHFKQLKLKKLITTHFNMDGSPSYKIEWEGEKLHNDMLNLRTTPLKGNGDFRSEECIEILKEADIVVTNPPFSLFREYVAQLMEYKKKFVIIGNNNAIAYKEVFPLLRDNKMWLGYGTNVSLIFRVADGYKYNEKVTKKIDDGFHYGIVPAITWYTNLDIDKRHEPLILTKNYRGHEEKYPKYVNFDAIDVGAVNMIPKDYFGKMGVPITYLAQYCQKQFEIIGLSGNGDLGKEIGIKMPSVEHKKLNKALRQGAAYILDKNGIPQKLYNRIIILRKDQQTNSSAGGQN